MAVVSSVLRSLRWRATISMALFLIAIAIAIRSVNYEVTREILVRDIDTQLWTRLEALKTRQQFAPESLLGPDLALPELALPDLRAASDLKPSVAMRLLIPSAVNGRPFPWFAGIWREDGALLAALSSLAARLVPRVLALAHPNITADCDEVRALSLRQLLHTTAEIGSSGAGKRVQTVMNAR
jgi:hypothetical protein